MKKIGHNNSEKSVGLSEETEMLLLAKISSMTAQHKKVADIISTTLSELSEKIGFVRATITLRNGDYLFIEDANGLDKESIKRGVYKIGEGITGKVAFEGKSLVNLTFRTGEVLSMTTPLSSGNESISYMPTSCPLN